MKISHMQMPWMVCIDALCILVALVSIWSFTTMRCVRSGDAMDGGSLAEIARTFSGQVTKFLENNRALPTVASTNMLSHAPSAVGSSCVDQNSSCASWASQVRLTHRHANMMLSTSCELDRHLSMISSSCDSEVEFDMHITMESRDCMHAL